MDSPFGEVGVLKEMRWSHMLKDHRCFPVIEYQNGMYIACVLFDDQTFCNQIFQILEAHIGFTIDRIGELDLSHTL